MRVLIGGMGWTGWTLSDEANALIESLPEAAHKLRVVIRSPASRPAADQLAKVEKAAAQLEQAAGTDASSRGIMRVRIEKPPFNLKEYLFAGTLHAAAVLGQFTVICFITYFLLASGDTFRRKLVRIAGPTFARQRITVQALDEIDQQIRRYLLVQLATSALVGVATAIAFGLAGLNNAAVWGIVAGGLNLVPYVGSMVVCGAAAIVALLQFGTLEMALTIAAICVVLHVISGYVITPWWMSRASRLNAVVVFIGVLAWGWLWGLWGWLLGTPMLMVIKAVCDRVDALKPVGELLGGAEPAKDRAAGA